MRRTEKRKRFSFAKFILVLLALGILGGTSYYVYKANKKAADTLDAASSEIMKTIPVVSKGPSVKLTDNWVGYSNDEGSFSLKYPTSWVQPTIRKNCAVGTFDRTVYLGPNTASVFKCATFNTNFGQIYIVSNLGDQRSKYALDTSTYKDKTTKTVGINGVVGNKTTGTATNVSKAMISSGIVNGTFNERYIFYANGNTYVAQYIQAPTGSSPSKNVLSDFDLMIIKTLKFHS